MNIKSMAKRSSTGKSERNQINTKLHYASPPKPDMAKYIWDKKDFNINGRETRKK